jgi:replication protein/transposase-like zinc-binding protein
VQQTTRAPYGDGSDDASLASPVTLAEAVGDAIDAWGESDALRAGDDLAGTYGPGQAGDELLEVMTGRAAAPRHPDETLTDQTAFDLRSLVLTRDVKSASGTTRPHVPLAALAGVDRYRVAAARVMDALEVAGQKLRDRVAVTSCSEYVGYREAMLRRRRAERALEAHDRRQDRIGQCTGGKVGIAVFKCRACNGEVDGVPMGCNARICPRCAPKLRKANQAKVLELLEAVDERRYRMGRGPAKWRFVTLTIASQPEFVPMRRALAAAWSKLLRWKFWRECVSACLVFFETTHTKAGWHVHLHALVDGYVPRDLLADAWFRCTHGAGQPQGVHISLPKGSRRDIAFELAKYLAKDLAGAASDEDAGDWGVAGTSDRLAEFYLGSLRWRSLRTYGHAYDAQSLIEANQVHAALLCECCGCHEPMIYDHTRWVAAHELALRSAIARSSLRESLTKRRNDEPPR